MNPYKIYRGFPKRMLLYSAISFGVSSLSSIALPPAKAPSESVGRITLARSNPPNPASTAAASRTGHRADTQPQHRWRWHAPVPAQRHGSDNSSARLPSPPERGAHVQSDLILRPEFRFYAWAQPHHQHLGRHRNPTTFASSAADGRTTWCAYTNAQLRLV